MAVRVQNLAELPDAPYYLYGDGHISHSINRTLTAERPSMPFKGFLTSFDSTATATNIQEAAGSITADDIILIANQFSREILHTLEPLGLPCRLYDGILLVFPWYDLAPPAKDLADFRNRAAAILPHLASDRSRDIYGFLTNCRFADKTERTPEAEITRFYDFMDHLYGTASDYAHLQYFEHGGIKPGATVIEGGGNVGQVARKILETTAPSGVLYSFEPLAAGQPPSSNSVTSEYLAQQRTAERYEVIPAALWSEPTQLSFQIDADNPASSRVMPAGEGSSRVEATSVDAFCADRQIEQVDFIKLDVEGAEPQVLAGAAETIGRCRPTLAVSIYHGATQMVTIPEQLTQSLDGYRFEIGHHSNTPWLETVLYCLPDRR